MDVYLQKARADFNTKKITSVTTEVLDKEKHDADKKDDFTSLKQLIVDVQSQDDTLYKQTNIERERLAQELMSPSQFEPISNMYRFTKAFNTFFDNKVKYFGVNDGDGEKRILFSKNGNNIPVDKLSTGEKQIVFRGAYLLKNSRNLNGGIIMVDEPELSMHPKWQKNILQYYKDLFTGTSGQNSQIFFATHSDHVLREALSDRVNNLVIVLTDDSGVTTPKRIDAPAVLPSITSAETNYLAFDIASNDYHIELYGWLQENQGFTSVKECDNYIAAHSSYITALHHKPTRGKGSTTYDTLPTAIRNSIHHPRTATPFSHEELGISVKLLFDILQSSTLTP